MRQLVGTREQIVDCLNAMGGERWELVRVDHQRWGYFKRNCDFRSEI